MAFLTAPPPPLEIELKCLKKYSRFILKRVLNFKPKNFPKNTLLSLKGTFSLIYICAQIRGKGGKRKKEIKRKRMGDNTIFVKVQHSDSSF